MWEEINANLLKKYYHLMQKQKNNDLYAIIIYENNRFDMEVMSSE